MKRNLLTYSLLPILIVLMFGCKNSNKEINDFLADKNLPVGMAERMVHIYKENGIVTSRLETPLYLDFSNRKLNPYSEFPLGLKIVTIDAVTRDSVAVTGLYAVTYQKTDFSRIEKNVVVTNYKENSILKTHKIYWDQKENYFYTDEAFVLVTKTDTLKGVGFESDGKLKNWRLGNTTGSIIIK